MPARLLKSQSIDYTTRNSEDQQLDMVVDEQGGVCVHVCVCARVCVCVCSSCFENTYFFKSDRDILFLGGLPVLTDKAEGLVNSIRN